MNVFEYSQLCFLLAVFIISFDNSMADQDMTNFDCGPNKTLSRHGTHCPDCTIAKCVRCGFTEKLDCYCKDGYILIGNESDDCVKTEDCPRCPGCACAINNT